MATANYNFIPGQQIWHLGECGISEGSILGINIVISPNATTIEYTISIKKDGSIRKVEESTLYATLTGVGSAMEAYENLLT